MIQSLREKIAATTLFLSIGEIAFALFLVWYAWAPASRLSTWIENNFAIVTIAVWMWLGTCATFGISFFGAGKRRRWAILLSLVSVVVMFCGLADAD